MVVTRFDNLANRTTLNAEKAIKRLFAEYYAVVANYAAEYAKTYNGQYSFRIDDFPELKKKVDELLKKMHAESLQILHNGIDSQFKISEDKQRALVNQLFGRSLRRFPKEAIGALLTNTQTAQEQFKHQRAGKFTLSQRVWKTQKIFRREMEVAMEIGLKDGKSARKISQDIRQFLNNPDALFRRVRNSNGNLKLSTRAKNYHPGQGVYRSAAQNAMRVARTETNRAYRSADQQRWANATYVVGVRIQTSNNSNKVCPRCKALEGDYPKEFDWHGWHPNCMCHRLSILKTREEMDEETRAILAGEEPNNESVNKVTEMPKQFKEWYQTNKEKIDGWKTKPDFIKDNPEWIKMAQVKNVDHIDKVYKFKDEFGARSKAIADKLGVDVTPVNLKSRGRIIEKAIGSDYGGDITEVKDIIRNTFIAPSGKLEDVVNEIKGQFDVSKIKSQNTSLGYTGYLMQVELKKGVFAEIQVNTPQMIYAKETAAKEILGKKLFAQIRQKTSLPSGLGHKFYEEYRVLTDLSSEVAKRIEEESRKYYEAIRKIKL